MWLNACDAGREGELIFRRVYQLSGSRKTVKRLWVSSMEDSAIRAGMEQLKDAEEYRNLAEAAVCRAKADWLVGMNATRAFTTKYYKKLTVGRVLYVYLFACHAGRPDGTDQKVPEGEVLQRGTGL